MTREKVNYKNYFYIYLSHKIGFFFNYEHMIITVVTFLFHYKDIFITLICF